MNSVSSSHFVIIPSYNTGRLLPITVEEALNEWLPVWVIIDGSDDNSEQLLKPLQAKHPETLKIIKLANNIGKGAAILHGLTQARAYNYTHVLTLDADHQHPANYISKFMALSLKNPSSMILGMPEFDASAPMLRVKGRKISNWWANLETLGWGIKDSLFGMRVYPIEDLMTVMQSTSWARRFDFEPEVAVRLAWLGVSVLNISTPVRYILKEDGGISQFKYGRDNLLLTGMHIRLFSEFLLRLPVLIYKKYSPTR